MAIRHMTFHNSISNFETQSVSLGLTWVAPTKGCSKSSNIVFLELCPYWLVRPDIQGVSFQIVWELLGRFYIVYTSVYSSNLSHVVWHFLPFLLVEPIHCPKVPTPAWESQCSHQDNLCLRSHSICWRQSCKIQRQHFFVLFCYWLFYWSHQPPTHPHVHSGIYVWIHEDWTIDHPEWQMFSPL